MLQLEETRRDVLAPSIHGHICALPVTDPRLPAWMSAGRGSLQWVTSHPTERMDLEGHGGQDFRIVITTYLGRECPLSRFLARDGRALAGPPGGADIPVDAHGHELARATHLPGGSHTVVHDVTGDELFSICEEAGVEVRREPRDIFSRGLPPAALIAAPGQGRPAIIPDAAIRVAMPAALTSSADRPTRARRPLRPSSLRHEDDLCGHGALPHTTGVRPAQRSSGAACAGGAPCLRAPRARA